MSQPVPHDRPASFAVVIPMYNEEAGAERCIAQVCRELSAISRRCALLVVEDGSTDRTRSLLQELEPRYANLRVVYHARNGGYGAALRTGIAESVREGYDYVLFMDSDLTNSPADIPRFFEKMDQGFDVIKATRYGSGGSVSGVPLYRVAISRFGNMIVRGLFRLPLSDYTNGFRAVRTSLLSQIQLTENKFSIIMEELYLLKPFNPSYAEVPVELTDRSADARPTSFSYRPSTFWNYLKYPLKSLFGMSPASD